MISNKIFFKALKNNQVDFFCGVPDSLLKNFCGYLTNQTSSNEHVITANEGGAIALASGYHLATGKLPLVYLQNSGLGNIINPLLSLADKEVYGIPMLLLIGWRGEPGIKDEPQHRKQGRVQNALLNAMEIPYLVLDADTENITEFVRNAANKAIDNNSPAAIVVRNNTFEPYSFSENLGRELNLSREKAIQLIVDKITDEDIIISTTGKPSRELYEYRVAKKKGHQNDFLTVGSMGHCSQIALGIALQTKRNVYCIDGDGAAIMHMGAFSINGTTGLSNFKHIILNNGAHDSVGGQPTCGFDISFTDIAKANGYVFAEKTGTEKGLNNLLSKFLHSEGPALLEVCVTKGARKDLGRPVSTPVENKLAFMDLLSNN